MFRIRPQLTRAHDINEREGRDFAVQGFRTTVVVAVWWVLRALRHQEWTSAATARPSGDTCNPANGGQQKSGQ